MTVLIIAVGLNVMAGLLDIITDGDYSLTVNGKSKHLDTDVPRNENNTGFGLLAEKDGKFLTAGGYKNSEWNPSYYVGGGYKKRFGNNFYIEPGILGGIVSGYEGGLIPMALPMVSIGKKGLGAINTMYAPRVGDDPAVIMFNMSVPFK